MEFRKWFENKVGKCTAFARKFVFIGALVSCLLNFTNCNHTVTKQEAPQKIKETIKEFVSNRSFHLGIELSEQDSAIINQQVQHFLNRIERYEEATDTTVQLNQKEVIYFAFLTELNILQEKLNNTKLSPEERKILTNEARYIEKILTNSDIHVIKEEDYNTFQQFFYSFFPHDTAPYPSPIQPQQ